MSAAYLIAQLKVTNSENYKEYIEKVPEIIKKYGCNKIINEIGDEFNFVILKSTDFILYNKKKIKNSLVKVFYKN